MNQSLLGMGRITGSASGTGSSIEGAWAKIIYTADPCVVNPLHSSNCKGYAIAMAKQLSASNNTYSRIMKKELIHPSDDIVSLQMQRAVRKNSGESWRIARKDSGTEIDAAVATVLAIWFVETQVKPQQMVH
jgi:hypothetical protein